VRCEYRSIVRKSSIGSRSSRSYCTPPIPHYNCGW
jgi:hypothetical protein